MPSTGLELRVLLLGELLVVREPAGNLPDLETLNVLRLSHHGAVLEHMDLAAAEGDDLGGVDNVAPRKGVQQGLDRELGAVGNDQVVGVEDPEGHELVVLAKL